MKLAFGMSVVGGFIGTLVAAQVHNSMLELKGEITLMIGISAGCIVGSIIGSTGAIVEAISKGKARDLDK